MKSLKSERETLNKYWENQKIPVDAKTLKITSANSDIVKSGRDDSKDLIYKLTLPYVMFYENDKQLNKDTEYPLFNISAPSTGSDGRIANYADKIDFVANKHYQYIKAIDSYEFNRLAEELHIYLYDAKDKMPIPANKVGKESYVFCDGLNVVDTLYKESTYDKIMSMLSSNVDRLELINRVKKILDEILPMNSITDVYDATGQTNLIVIRCEDMSEILNVEYVLAEPIITNLDEIGFLQDGIDMNLFIADYALAKKEKEKLIIP